MGNDRLASFSLINAIVQNDWETLGLIINCERCDWDMCISAN